MRGWPALAALLLLLQLHAPAGAEQVLDAGPLASPTTLHAPFRFTSDAHLDLAPDVPGSGTAEDPYRIEGWSFLLPTRQAASDPATSTGLAGATILLANTHAHVLIRANTFAAQGRLDATPLDTGTEAAIAVTNATNVSIVGNEFRGTGGWQGSIALGHAAGSLSGGLAGTGGPSERIRVEGNTFRALGGPAVVANGAQAEILSNDVTLLRHDAAIVLGEPRDGTRVADNRLRADYGVLVHGDGSHVEIAGNDVQADVAALWLAGDAQGTLVRDNHLHDSAACIVTFGDATVRGNTLDRCGRPLHVDLDAEPDVHDTNTVDGRPTLWLHDLADATLTLQEPLGWIRVARVTNLTLLGLDLPENGQYYFLDVQGLTLRDARVLNTTYIEGGGPIVLAQSVLRGARLEAHGEVTLDGVEARDHRGGDYSNGHGIQVNQYENATIHVRGLRATGNVADGLFVGVNGPAFPSICPHVVIEDTVLEGNGIAGLRTNTFCGDVTVRGSSIAHNRFFGVTSEGTLPLDLRGNWWGGPEGPVVSRDPFTPGSIAVRWGALYDPWLDARPDVGT